MLCNKQQSSNIEKLWVSVPGVSHANLVLVTKCNGRKEARARSPTTY